MVMKPVVQNKKSQKKETNQDPLRVKFTKVDAMQRFKRKFQGDTTTKTPKTNSDLGGTLKIGQKFAFFLSSKHWGQAVP